MFFNTQQFLAQSWGWNKDKKTKHKFYSPGIIGKL